MNHHKIFHQNI